MDLSNMQVFCVGSTFFMKLPDGTFFSVTATARVAIIEELPVKAEQVKPYPFTGMIEPPSSTLSLMKAVLTVAEHFIEKQISAPSEEKSAP